MTCPCNTCQNVAPKFEEAEERFCDICGMENADQFDDLCRECRKSEEIELEEMREAKRKKWDRENLIDKMLEEIK